LQQAETTPANSAPQFVWQEHCSLPRRGLHERDDVNDTIDVNKNIGPRRLELCCKPGKMLRVLMG
jgi:hypothetical protein